MRWLFLILLIAGCHSQQPKHPKPSKEKITKQEREEEKTHTAPPPAWGNKVVMLD